MMFELSLLLVPRRQPDRERAGADGQSSRAHGSPGRFILSHGQYPLLARLPFEVRSHIL